MTFSSAVFLAMLLGVAMACAGHGAHLRYRVRSGLRAATFDVLGIVFSGFGIGLFGVMAAALVIHALRGGVDFAVF